MSVSWHLLGRDADPRHTLSPRAGQTWVIVNGEAVLSGANLCGWDHRMTLVPYSGSAKPLVGGGAFTSHRLVHWGGGGEAVVAIEWGWGWRFLCMEGLVHSQRGGCREEGRRRSLLCVTLLGLTAAVPPPPCWPSVSALAFGRLSGMQGWKVSHLPQKGSKELFSLTFWKERGRREEEEGQNRRRVWALRPPWGLPTAGGGFSGWSLRTC